MKMKLGVLFGGASVEHEISILSSLQAMDHFNQEAYEIIPIYIAKNKKMYSDACLRNLDVYKDLDALCKKLKEMCIVAREQKFYIQPTQYAPFKKAKEIDMVFPIMHGTNGEDGVVQGYLKMLGVPFCGSDVLSAAIGQDKAIMKDVLAMHQVPMLPWLTINRYEDMEMSEQRIAEFGYPVIIKPANLGSSVGIHVVHSHEEVRASLQEAFLYDEKVVVERYVGHLKELNCSVLGGDGSYQCSCIEEVIKQDQILSYQDKYEKGSKAKGMVNTSRILPAPLEEVRKDEIEEVARTCVNALGVRGVVRIDFIMDIDTQKIYVNEINTIPGSLSFYLWEPIGISFEALLDHIISLSLSHQRLLEQMIFTYPTNVLSTFSYQGKMMK